MRQDSNIKPKTKTLNMILMDGGLGDKIADLTAVDYTCKKYPWIKILLWCPDFLVGLAKHLLPASVDIKGYSAMRHQYNPNKTTKTTKWDGITSPMKIHLLDYSFLKLCDENPSIEHKNYLQIRPNEIVSREFDLPDSYAVITTAYTAKVREFPPETINKLSDYLNNLGITPVFLGQRDTSTGASHNIKGNINSSIDYTKGIDLIDKTTLLEAANIMNYAKVVIGVDNGLLHLAGCTKAPIIGGFTTVSPLIRWPVRNSQLGWNCFEVVPESELGCRFCQQTTNFLYGHDYRDCWYDDFKCVKSMSFDAFKRQLDVVLS